MGFRFSPLESMGVIKLVDVKFWEGKRVYITGHTGFKGGWLTLWLQQMGAIVKGFSLEPSTTPNLFSETKVDSSISSEIGDICDYEAVRKSIGDFQPEIVFHLAAQSLVRFSYNKPVYTYQTNVMGTVHLLEAVRKTGSVRAIINVTSDKCYENKEWLWGYREDEPKGGYDPYSSSKGCAELISSAYRNSFLSSAGVALATARAGNVIGGGDWAADRIVPDAMRAFIKNKPLMIRNPHAVRPWQHVLEPLSGYLMLCQKLIENPKKYAEGWNFGPQDDDAQPVSVLADIMVDSWRDGAHWKSDEGQHPHEARYLKLDCSKANSVLGWTPIWELSRALSESVQWYKAWHQRKDMRGYTLRQIEKYQQEKLKR